MIRKTVAQTCTGTDAELAQLKQKYKGDKQIQRVLDVTIVYPDGASSFWALLCGKISEIKVRVRSLPVSPELLGDYTNDGNFRAGLQVWLNNIWAEKNRLIEEMMPSWPKTKPG